MQSGSSIYKMNKYIQYKNRNITNTKIKTLLMRDILQSNIESC